MSPEHWLRRLVQLYGDGEGCYPLRMGLDDATWQALQRTCGLCVSLTPEAADRRRLMSELIACRDEERMQLSAWLSAYLSPGAAPMTEIIACVSLAFNHLWQDLGLSSRAELRTLMSDCFPALVVMNQHNMRWKKFFYRQRCVQSAGEVLCRSPSCDLCCERQRCFAPEGG